MAPVQQERHIDRLQPWPRQVTQQNHTLVAAPDWQSDFEMVWQPVASRFRDDSGVIGYDLFNEPRPIPVPAHLFEERWMWPLYARIIDAIGSVDSNHPFLVEGILLWDFRTLAARLRPGQTLGSAVRMGLPRVRQGQVSTLTRTRARSVETSTQLAGRIFAAARSLLEHETDGTRFRLLGVGVSAIDSATAADPADLVDGRAALAEHAVDNLRARFGDTVLVRGLGFEPADK